MYYTIVWITCQLKGSLDPAAVVSDHVPVWHSVLAVFLALKDLSYSRASSFVVEVDGLVNLATPTTLVLDEVYSVSYWAINAGHCVLSFYWVSFNYNPKLALRQPKGEPRGASQQGGVRGLPGTLPPGLRSELSNYARPRAMAL
jgi:hypothetical protein